MSKKRTKRKTEYQRYESIFAKLKPIERNEKKRGK